jgi:FtsH-binding integral membrane protein
MLNKVYRFFEYAYLVIAAFFAYEAVMNWNTEPNRAYLFIFFVVVALFMFFFKRNFRKKIQERNKN